jgi:hypothetical protein
VFDLSEHTKPKPTVGRIVHFYTRDLKQQWNGAGQGPYAAVITQAIGYEYVSLYVLPNCPLMQPRVYQDVPLDKDASCWWEWPPLA